MHTRRELLSPIASEVRVLFRNALFPDAVVYRVLVRLAVAELLGVEDGLLQNVHEEVGHGCAGSNGRVREGVRRTVNASRVEIMPWMPAVWKVARAEWGAPRLNADWLKKQRGDFNDSEEQGGTGSSSRWH